MWRRFLRRRQGEGGKEKEALVKKQALVSAGHRINSQSCHIHVCHTHMRCHMCVTHICVVACVSHTYALSHVCHTHMRCHMCASNYIYDVGRCLCVRPSYPLSRVTYMCVTHICVVICVPATIYVKLVGTHVLCHRTYSVVSHICVSYTYMCVSHTYELSCVPATIYMLVGAHVLCHRTHLVVSHICVSHTYMCVTHI